MNNAKVARRNKRSQPFPQPSPEFSTDELFSSAWWHLRDRPAETRRLETERERVRQLVLETIIVAGVLEDLEGAQ